MLEVDKLLNVSLSVFRDLRNNSLDIKSFPVDIFTGLKNLREMWVLLTTRVSFAWKLGVALYYLVPRFPTASFDLDSRLGATISECVVPENIYSSPSPSPSHGWKQRKFREEGGGVQKEAISEGVGVASRGLQVRSMSYLKLTAALLRKLSVIFLLTVF